MGVWHMIWTLHSNMFLLIRVLDAGLYAGISYFTFQYVSINTQDEVGKYMAQGALHSNMFLLIRKSRVKDGSREVTLHSNMFLLIPADDLRELYAGIIFTFQYVSINTPACCIISICRLSLHSNMFLLIHDLGAERSTEYMPLHSNMFLLIRCRLSGSERPRLTFTFQYVSINTIVLRDFTGRFLSLHSNMFLLIHPRRYAVAGLGDLYIPICFY